MTRPALLNAALAIAVAALGAWVYFKPAKDAPADIAPLSALKSEEAVSVRIERPGAAPVLLEKLSGAWRMTAPFAARSDEQRTLRLLEILGARPVQAFAADDLARFELDRPQARLTIGQQVFSLGMVNSVTREQYLLTNGSVYAVDPRYAAALPANAAEMASHRLFGPGETPVRVELPAFTVEQRDGKWVQLPQARDYSQDDFVRWADEWRNATALLVGPAVKGKVLETIRIQLKQGGALSLGVLAREPQLVLLRPDENLQYHFSPEIAQRLLSPPGGTSKQAGTK